MSQQFWKPGTREINPASSKRKKAVSFSLPPLSSASSSSFRFGYASIGSKRQRLIFKLMGIHSPDGKF
jgi:ATP-dependent RNA helicase DDX35